MTTTQRAALTPASLVGKSLDIPLYQRLFVWEEEQIDKLLNDLWNEMSTKNELPYYIGIVTIKDNQNNSRWEIVDGQQRLTFLTLFGCECIKANIDQERWNDFVFCGVIDEKPQPRIHYVGRQEDEATIQALASKSFTGDAEAIENTHMRCFHECWSKFIFGKSDHEKVNFSKYVYEKTSFLVSELPSAYTPKDLNSFFEKMNASGRQLEPEVMIKGTYFCDHATRWNKCLDFSKRLTDPGQKGKSIETANGVEGSILDLFQKNEDPELAEPANDFIEERELCHAVLKPAVFLLHVLKLTMGKAVSFDGDKLIGTFASFSNELPKAKFIDQMESYRNWLDHNIIYIKYNDGNRIEYRFWFDDEQKQDASDIPDVLKLRQFQSMLYVESSEAQEWVLEAYQSATESGLSTQELLPLLRKQDTSRHQLPSDSALCFRTINRYWFWKLDYLLWEKFIDNEEYFLREFEVQFTDKKEIDAIKNYRFRRNRSIEHLHPQNPLNELPEWEKDRTREQDTIRNGFGNLAMISSSLNSAQSNDGIGVKFGRVKDQLMNGNLESIKMLVMFKLAKENESGWNPVLADKHQKAMLKLLSEDA